MKFVHGGVVKSWSLHTCAHEGDRTFIVQFILLSEYINKIVIIRKIVEQKVFTKVWVVQHGCFFYNLFDMGKHILFHFIPFVNYILLHHLLYRFENLGIIGDELVDEVDLPQERLLGFILH